MNVPIITLIITLILLPACKQEDKLSSLQETILPPDQKTITIKINNYCLESDHRRSDFFVVQMSARIENKRIFLDIDNDGIPNYRDNNGILNIDLYAADTNSDGYSDLLVYYAGFDSEQQKNLPECLFPHRDDDVDGLTNCEEKVIGTDPGNFDSDHDGVPDYLEVRYGMEPLPSDNRDAYLDPDMDGYKNFEEIKMNTPLYETNDHSINKMALAYNSMRMLDNTTQECYEYTVTNIPIMDSSSGNLIKLFFIEKNSNNPTLKYMYTYALNISNDIYDKEVVEYEYVDMNSFLVGNGY